MVNLIFHISDILIKDIRRDEYKSVFNELFKYITQADAIVVITGNLFDKKENLSSINIFDAQYFLKELVARCKVILIPGVNDYSKRYKRDLIKPIAESIPQISYYNKSGVYIYENISFSVFIYDDGVKVNKTEDNRTKIAIFQYNDQRVILENYDICLGGNTTNHSIQNNTSFAGCLIQQSFGDSYTKGMIKWTISPVTNEFIAIENSLGCFLKVKLLDDSVQTTIFPEKVRDIIIEHSNCSEQFMTNTKRMLEVKYRFNNIAKVINIDTNIQQKIEENAKNFYNIEVQKLLIKNFLQNKCDDSVIDKILQLHSCNETYFAKSKKWNLLRLSFSNLFCFEGENTIDFSTLGGISGIIAKNRAGKSAILDILVFGLFNRLLRGDRNSIMHHGSLRYKIRVEFAVENKQGIISREFDGRKNAVKFIYDKQNQSEKSVIATYNNICSVIGSFDDFIMTTICLQEIGQYNFLQCGDTKRKELLNSLFGLNLFSQLERKIKKNIIGTRAVLKLKEKELQQESVDVKISKLRKQIEKTKKLDTTLKERVMEAQNRKEQLIAKSKQLDFSTQRKELAQWREKLDCIPKLEINIQEKLDAAYKSRQSTTWNGADPHKRIAELRAKIKFLPNTPSLEIQNTINMYKKYSAELAAKQREFGAEETKLNLREKMTFADCQSCRSNQELLSKTSNANSDKVVAMQLQLFERANINLCKRMEAICAEKAVLGGQEREQHERELCEINAYVNNQNIEKRIVYLQTQQQFAEQKAECVSKIETLSKLIPPEDNAEVASLQHKIKTLLSKQDCISNELVRLNVSVSKLCEQKKTVAKTSKFIDETKRKLEILEKYHSCLDVKKGIPQIILSQIVKYLENDVNTFLQRFTDFKILIDPDLKIFIIDKKLTLPIDLCSGYQRFVVSIILKICFNKFANAPLPNVLFIDEGFGCLDEENLINIQYLLNNTGKDFVFIISHIEYLQSCIQKPIYIDTINYVSRIV